MLRMRRPWAPSWPDRSTDPGGNHDLRLLDHLNQEPCRAPLHARRGSSSPSQGRLPSCSEAVNDAELSIGLTGCGWSRSGSPVPVTRGPTAGGGGAGTVAQVSRPDVGVLVPGGRDDAGWIVWFTLATVGARPGRARPRCWLGARSVVPRGMWSSRDRSPWLRSRLRCRALLPLNRCGGGGD
jgi:hypothetical protein